MNLLRLCLNHIKARASMIRRYHVEHGNQKKQVFFIFYGCDLYLFLHEN
jgi:hypothetical protein